MARTLVVLLLLLSSCQPGDGPGDSRDPQDTEAPGSAQDILTTHLALDLAALTGRAELLVQPDPARGAVWLEVGGLTVTGVTVDGAMVEPHEVDGMLRVPTPESDEPVLVAVDYGFPERTVMTFDGWMPGLGVSFVWPDYCSNLFPCDASLTDGVTFTMEITGVEEGLEAIYPRTTVSDAPAYMPAVAVGDYTELDLGTTAAGTRLSAWYLPGEDALRHTEQGTAHLLAAFEFFETTYGPYAFGPHAGTVEVDWGADSWGGMEHHPYFHVGQWDFRNEETQVHEAAHGWYGDGVRMACWEDFVLSEGTVTYMTARALEQVGGPDLWPMYVDDFLAPICNGREANVVVLPETCDITDFARSDLWSLAPYMKGACFYEDVAELIGAVALDRVIAAFYTEHVNDAARMREMIEALEDEAGPQRREALDTLVTEWLLTLDCPEDWSARCRAHAR
jgi:aminopeptidase N